METKIGVSVKLEVNTLTALRRVAAQRQIKTGQIWTATELIREGVAMVLQRESAKKD